MVMFRRSFILVATVAKWDLNDGVVLVLDECCAGSVSLVLPELGRWTRPDVFLDALVKCRRIVSLLVKVPAVLCFAFASGLCLPNIQAVLRISLPNLVMMLLDI